ncbi:MAG: hypothetical protein M1537_01690 [Nitrospirae bacterium]|nr:hypothetical protein [Nitrospirota bacterium]MCL5284181.1 hypothetical protein [Nitrospirota bacterium]
MNAQDETVVHAEAVHERAGQASPGIVLAGFWAAAGLVLMGVGMALHGHPGTLLAGMR